MKWLLLLVSMVLAISTVVLGQQEKHKWHRSEYPNPRKNPDACSRREPSFICDPNFVLTEQDATEIENIMKEIFQATKCPCKKPADCNGDTRGFMPMVLIMDEMTTDAERANDRKKMMDTNYMLEQAKLFGYTQMKRYNISRCGDDIIVVFSADTRVLYTVTGEMAKMKLTEGLIGEISYNYMKDFYGDSAGKKMGFTNLLNDYKAVLLGKYESYIKHGSQDNPSYEAVKDSSNMAAAKTGSVVLMGLTLLLAVFGGL